AVNQKNKPIDNKKESKSKNLFKIFEFRFFYLRTVTTYVTASFSRDNQSLVAKVYKAYSFTNTVIKIW
ncbi:hypothetical protein, partial [Vagococcus fluvialis]|uniref:hypothetical protein n=1 Tax=Vagococcus fluvialis TaxID=2738 RepID=UPI003B5C7B53